MTDPIAAILDAWQRESRQLAYSPADYQQACQWVEDGIPSRIVVQTLERTVAHQKGGRLSRYQLRWFDADVREQYDEFRRLVGPRG